MVYARRDEVFEILRFEFKTATAHARTPAATAAAVSLIVFMFIRGGRGGGRGGRGGRGGGRGRRRPQLLAPAGLLALLLVKRLERARGRAGPPPPLRALLRGGRVGRGGPFASLRVRVFHFIFLLLQSPGIANGLNSNTFFRDRFLGFYIIKTVLTGILVTSC